MYTMKSGLGISWLLGVALGTGYMTSLRFAGLVGPSELIMFIVISLLLIKHARSLIIFGYGFEAIAKAYIIISILVVMPLVTVAVYSLAGLDKSMPEYVLSFMLSTALLFLLVESVRNGTVDMKAVALSFAAVFLLTNIFFLSFVSVGGSSRESSFSNNPNQLLFYISSLSLLLAIYSKKLLAVVFIPLCFVGVKSGSDAYVLSLFVVGVTYIYFRVLFSSFFALHVNLIIQAIIGALVAVGLLAVLGDEVWAIWQSADEGGTRVDLMKHAFVATIYSPIFGWGAGSFSGLSEAFQGAEAHNTFLDLSMQFGVFVPVLIYGLIVFALFSALRQRQFLIAAFMVAFIVSGLFHFSGRHFVFWVEIAVMWTYVFTDKATNKDYSVGYKDTPKCAV